MSYEQLREFERDGNAKTLRRLEDELKLQSRVSAAVFDLLQRWVEVPRASPDEPIAADEYAAIHQCIQAFNSLEGARLLLTHGYARQTRVVLRQALEQVSLAVHFVHRPQDATRWLQGAHIRPSEIGKVLKKEGRYDELQNLYGALSEPVHANWEAVDNRYLQSGAVSVAIGPQFSRAFLLNEWIVYMMVALVATSMCLDTARAYYGNDAVLHSLQQTYSRVIDAVDPYIQPIMGVTLTSMFSGGF